MRVLVTGGNGFLGYEATCRLLARGDAVVAIDTAIGPSLAGLAAEHDTVVTAVCDITERPALAATFAEHRPDAVIHLAAIVGVPASLDSPHQTVRVNIEGSLNVFEAMLAVGARRVIHMSSEETYGDFPAPVVDETCPPLATTPYGVTKVVVEGFGRAYGEAHGLECINLRASWVYGVRLSRPRPPMTYLDAALTGTPLHAPTGADTFIDYTYVDDVMDAVLLALDHADHPYDVYNVASGEAITDAEMIEIIRHLVPGAELSVGPGRRRFAEAVAMPVKGALDISRAQDVLGFRPRYDMRRGLARYVEQWRALNG
jgi:nucleoside-diphosphate-sugar epimerase